MKAFLISTGTVFTLIVVAHAARIHAEPQIAREPWFWVATALAAVLAAWAWWLVSRHGKND
jgi:hypothetical protein